MNDASSPPNAQQTAESYRIDLSDHRSSQATSDIVSAADLILVMDYRNYHNFSSRFPSARSRTFLLGVFGRGHTMQITDPHGYSEAVFDSVYEDIASCVDQLLAEYQTRR
jgi:protein-tyrosine phosphatase